MSDTLTLANGLDVFSACENEDHVTRFVCECGRKFYAKTDARVGVTRSNATRHATACPTAIAYVPPAPKADEKVDDMVAAAKVRQDVNTPFEVTPSGDVAKMVYIGVGLWMSTDGKWAVAKLGTGAESWSLYRIHPQSSAPFRFTGRKFPTCTAAFAPANLA